MSRQIEVHRCVLADLGVDPDLPARLTRETINHRQAKTRPLAERVGGKVGLEGFGDNVGRHARSSVGHADGYVLADWQILLPGRALVQPLVPGLDRELAAVRHRVARLDAEVHNLYLIY